MKKPIKRVEQVAGIGGATLAAPWVFTGVLHLLDWISRAQTVVAVAPYLGTLMTPPAFLTEFVGAVGLLFYATRLEHFREADEAPRIILAWQDPPKIKRHWIWLKAALTVVAVAFLVATITGIRILRKAPELSLPPNTAKSSVPLAVAAPTQPQRLATKHESKHRAGEQPVPTKAIDSTPGSTAREPSVASANESTPVASPSPNSPNSSVPSQITATINGKPVRASDKPTGTLYVSVRLSEVTSYRGTVDEKTFDQTIAAIERSGPFKAFKVESSYDVNVPSRSYGLNITPVEPRHIYYFEKSSQQACETIASLIAKSLGSMRCEFFGIPASSPNQLNLQHDFLTVSGLDMEVVI